MIWGLRLWRGSNYQEPKVSGYPGAEASVIIVQKNTAFLSFKIHSPICPPIFSIFFSIYPRATILPDQVLASVPIPCQENIRNIGSSNSLLFFFFFFFLWSSSMFALFFSGIWRRTRGRMENIRTSAKEHRGRWTQWSEIITTQTSRNSCVVGEEGERFTKLGATSSRGHVWHKWNSATGIWRELAYSNLGPISRKTRYLIAPGKQFFKLWSAYREKMLF